MIYLTISNFNLQYHNLELIDFTKTPILIEIILVKPLIEILILFLLLDQNIGMKEI